MESLPTIVVYPRKEDGSSDSAVPIIVPESDAAIFVESARELISDYRTYVNGACSDYFEYYKISFSGKIDQLSDGLTGRLGLDELVQQVERDGIQDKVGFLKKRRPLSTVLYCR
ncbi:hypothetical protein V6R97_05760 [Chromohalobacter salexigens]|uniref:hypothetical protein n=1 Tax=Chromohalobacter israelensis TaxID=141390 RepID=UPI0032E926D4